MSADVIILRDKTSLFLHFFPEKKSYFHVLRPSEPEKMVFANVSDCLCV